MKQKSRLRLPGTDKVIREELRARAIEKSELKHIVGAGVHIPTVITGMQTEHIAESTIKFNESPSDMLPRLRGSPDIPNFDNCSAFAQPLRMFSQGITRPENYDRLPSIPIEDCAEVALEFLKDSTPPLSENCNQHHITVGAERDLTTPEIRPGTTIVPELIIAGDGQVYARKSDGSLAIPDTDDEHDFRQNM